MDPRHGGDKALAEQEARYGKLPNTLRVRTGGGGLHFYFKHPGGSIKNKAGLLPGVDVRGDGGYVVAPRSLHKSGRRYEWDGDPARSALADVPPWLLLLVGMRQPALESTMKAHVILCEGTRNATLASLAGTMQRRGMTRGAILAALLAENKIRCNPPLEVREVEKIAKSISRYESDESLGAEPAHDFESQVHPSAQEISGESRPEWPPPATREAVVEAGRKLIEWLLEPVLVRGTIALLHGMPKAGKSELALALAVALARGVWPWGEWRVPRAVRVGIFSFEDSLRRLGRRLLRYGEGEWPLIWPRGHVPRVELPVDEVRLIDFIRQNRLEVLIVDVLLYTIGGANENSSSEMHPWCAALGRIVEATDCALVILHHARKKPAGRADSFDDVREAGRGTSAIKGAVDLIIGGHRKGNLLSLTLVGKDDQEGEYVVTFAPGAGDVSHLWTVERFSDADKSSKEAAVLSAIKAGQGRSLSTIAKAANSTKSTVGRIVTGLRAAKRVEYKPGVGYVKS
jgi:hypothetical protein